VVPSDEIHAFEPEDAVDYVDANEKVYRHATAYDIPDEVGHM
jgi:1,2-phenylacetyl-CoA epoxidase PaaB subunit